MKFNVICLTGLGDYRKGVVEKIISQDHKIKIIAGDEAFEKSIKLLNNNDFKEIKIVDNIFLANREFMYQANSFGDCLKAEKLIIDLNPRVLNVWFVIFTRMILGRKTCTWGHAWARNGKFSILRYILKKMSHKIIVYTETQRNELLNLDSKLDVIAAPNSLYSETDILDNLNYLQDNPKNMIHVGRIVKSKKVDLIIKAYNEIKNSLDPESKLIIVGDGEERANVEKLIKDLNLENSVILAGHVTDKLKLRDYYISSFVSISAGYVGLSITQSFSFGVPMLISKDEPHSPEIEAAKENINSKFFKTDSFDDLSKNILNFYNARNYWSQRRIEIIKDCAQNYSTEMMANRVLSSFED